MKLSRKSKRKNSFKSRSKERRRIRARKSHFYDKKIGLYFTNNCIKKWKLDMIH